MKLELQKSQELLIMIKSQVDLSNLSTERIKNIIETEIFEGIGAYENGQWIDTYSYLIGRYGDADFCKQAIVEKLHEELARREELTKEA